MGQSFEGRAAKRRGRRFRRPPPLSWERLLTAPGGVCHACTSRPRPILGASGQRKRRVANGPLFAPRRHCAVDGKDSVTRDEALGCVEASLEGRKGGLGRRPRTVGPAEQQRRTGLAEPVRRMRDTTWRRRLTSVVAASLVQEKRGRPRRAVPVFVFRPATRPTCPVCPLRLASASGDSGH
jgi:hypothetical protein